MRATVVVSFGCLCLALLAAQCGTSQETGPDPLSDAAAEGPLGADRGSAGDATETDGLSGGPGGADQTAPDVALIDSTGAGAPNADAVADALVAHVPDGTAGGSSDAGCDTCPYSCCGGNCVYLGNDQHNCGACGVTCGGSTPYCSRSCQANPCYQEAGACSGGGAGSFCCGFDCCTEGQICCAYCQPVTVGSRCYTPTAAHPSCPIGDPQCTSDRSLKRDVRPVDTEAVLEKVARMPISTWSYKSDDPRVRHLGPMAQDFHAAFGLGNTDRAYHPIDAHGVALAAIQALYDRLSAQQRRIEQLERENAEREHACDVENMSR
jgi:Chaperone of endosialidase